MVYSVPFEFVYPEKKGCHAIVWVKINGISARFIIDTGASHTVMDMGQIQDFDGGTPELLETLSSGLGSNMLQSSSLKIATFELGDLTIPQYKMVLIDLSNINEIFSQLGIETISGILGGDLLLKYKVKIDYKFKKITFRQRNVKSKV